jgi:hypothetical protein
MFTLLFLFINWDLSGKTVNHQKHFEGFIWGEMAFAAAILKKSIEQKFISLCHVILDFVFEPNFEI